MDTEKISNLKKLFTYDSDHLGKSIFNIIPLPIFICTLDEGLIYANHQSKLLLGYSQADLVGKPCSAVLKLIAPDNDLMINQVVTENKINVNLRLILKHKKGNQIPALVSINPLIDEKENTIGLLTFIEDLRENIKRKDLQHFSDYIINSINSGVIAIDKNSQITAFNKAAEKMTGLRGRSVLGKNYKEVFYKIHRDVKLLPEKVFSGEIISNVEFSSPINQDQLLCLDTGPIKDEMGFIKGAVGIIRDVTQQHSLSILQHEFKFIMDSINAGVIAINEKHIVTAINREAELITGLNSDEILGNKIEEFTFCNSPNGVICLDSLTTGKEYNHYETHIHVQGQKKTLSMNSTQIKNDNGKVIGAVSVFFDITTQKKYEENLQRAEKLAALGEMAAGTAHEIRNPLTSVRGFLQLMDNKFTDADEEKEYIRIMMSEIDSANNIIKDFLLFSKPQAPKKIIMDINDLLNDLRLIIEHHNLFTETDFVENYAIDLPNVIIDPDQIKQVLVNITQNALQAMNSGGTLSISTRWNIIDSLVEIIIRDNGQGIAKENINKIFDPFFSTKDVGKGTGLGLTIAYQIIKEHQGQINVFSEVGKGTEFIIKLPAQTKVATIINKELKHRVN